MYRAFYTIRGDLSRPGWNQILQPPTPIDVQTFKYYLECRSVALNGHRMRSYYVYILTNRKNGTLYIGVTNDLIRRVDEHTRGAIPGFTKKYQLKKLVWFDETDDITAAIWKERRMKKWYRKWKIRLIEEQNPEWRDLSDDFM